VEGDSVGLLQGVLGVRVGVAELGCFDDPDLGAERAGVDRYRRGLGGAAVHQEDGRAVGCLVVGGGRVDDVDLAVQGRRVVPAATFRGPGER